MKSAIVNGALPKRFRQGSLFNEAPFVQSPTQAESLVQSPVERFINEANTTIEEHVSKIINELKGRPWEQLREVLIVLRQLKSSYTQKANHTELKEGRSDKYLENMTKSKYIDLVIETLDSIREKHAFKMKKYKIIDYRLLDIVKNVRPDEVENISGKIKGTGEGTHGISKVALAVWISGEKAKISLMTLEPHLQTA